MRYILLVALAMMTISTTSFARTNKVYGKVLVTDISPADNALWKRENTAPPLYPIELARSGLQGCTVLSFDISESGKAKNIEAIQSVPHRSLGKYSRKMLKKWKWTPVATAGEAKTEQRTLRLDFCMGDQSSEQTLQRCQQQTQLACNTN